MMTNPLLLEIKQKAIDFEPISLAQMENVKLMNRMDAKFLIPVCMLPGILTDLLPHYWLLVIDGFRLCEYQTLYFDTPDLRLYHLHRQGKLNRYKIRQRHYVLSDLTFTEVKFKNNKGRTIKTRIRNFNQPNEELDQESKIFLAQQTPFNPEILRPILWVDYTRMTFVSRTTAERLTLDLGLTFRNERCRKSYPQLVVAEVKQESIRHSLFLNLMKDYRMREGGLSKYCLGMISLCSTIEHNCFKPKLNYLKKIIIKR